MNFSKSFIFSLAFTWLALTGNEQKCYAQSYSFEFYGHTFNFQSSPELLHPFTDSLTHANIRLFYQRLDNLGLKQLIERLQQYRTHHELDDWLYYQLVRKTAEQLSPKAINYPSYTLYKWLLMIKSGYDARVAVGNNQIIFYIRCEEDIADIPYFVVQGKKYMCLNYHDYGKLFQTKNTYQPFEWKETDADGAFSYRIGRLPDFSPDSYIEKPLEFSYKQKTYHFSLKINPHIETLFANYPGVDFESYFNIPLSEATYQSLIPALKENVKRMSKKKGVDYLMQFTRYAFLYETDDVHFGREKRLSPEETLVANYSDCDDRVALFFYLVREIYNLPMIAILYPTHITMAVAFDKPVGKGIQYNGRIYSFCEPTPQKENLKLGQLSSALKNQPHQVVYAYQP